MFITEFEDNILTAVIDGADLQKWHDEIINTNDITKTSTISWI